jgi:3-oxoacyl-[acyl-carrier protein] reductase
MKLDNKTALVTGGSRGIGAAIARRLARDGAAVAIVSRTASPAADAVVKSIVEAGGRAKAFQADVSDEASVRQAVQAIAAHYGRIDVLVNNAGTYQAAPVGEVTRAMFQEQMDMHAWSVVAMTQAALPHFPSEGGAIVNVSTNLVHTPGHGHAVYSAAKAAVEVLTKGFAAELGPRQIRVNAVAPAITRTDMTADIPAEHLREETAATPLGRLAEPEDIADVVAFLASHDARWVTGRTLLTDGGRI